jgi:hypothetical protein
VQRPRRCGSIVSARINRDAARSDTVRREQIVVAVERERSGASNPAVIVRTGAPEFGGASREHPAHVGVPRIRHGLYRAGGVRNRRRCRAALHRLRRVSRRRHRVESSPATLFISAATIERVTEKNDPYVLTYAGTYAGIPKREVPEDRRADFAGLVQSYVPFSAPM